VHNNHGRTRWNVRSVKASWCSSGSPTSS